jgi:hypothetical protein
VEECKFTEFGLAVKTKLLRLGRSQKWLEEEVASRTGKFMDDSLMYKILTGERKASKMVEVICEILGIELPTE